MDDSYDLLDSAINLVQIREFNVHNFVRTNGYTMSINTEHCTAIRRQISNGRVRVTQRGFKCTFFILNICPETDDAGFPVP
jgi:hypothetical protein